MLVVFDPFPYLMLEHLFGHKYKFPTCRLECFGYDHNKSSSSHLNENESWLHLYSTKCSNSFSVAIIVVVCFTLKPASSCNLLVVLEDSGTMMLFISIIHPCMFVIIQQLYYIALGFLLVLISSASSFKTKITGQNQCCHLVSWFHNIWNKDYCACIMCSGSISLINMKNLKCRVMKPMTNHFSF